MIDRLLDAGIYYSFDRTGFERHSRSFRDQDLEVNLEHKRVLITGANSGIGRSTAHQLASLGAEVWLLCRSAERGGQALEDIRFATGNNRVQLRLVDVSDLASVRALADGVEDVPIHGLVHNAGVLPDRRTVTADELESAWATHVTGPCLLTDRLLPQLRRAGDARVIWVSSGGMYTQKLSLDDIHWRRRDYDGVKAYAQTKRAQVILAEQWAERLKPDGVAVFSMHPGWADTPSVRTALPGFWHFTRNRLRTPRQGADTVVWLTACEGLEAMTGRLFFDRRPVRSHFLPWTRERSRDRRRLWRLWRGQAGLESSEAAE